MEIQHFFSLLAEQIGKQTPLDWAITVTALAYVFLAARENIWCWAWGIASCSMWAYADFVRYNLWADGVLQLFYVGMGFWGLYTWKRGDAGPSPVGTQSAGRTELHQKPNFVSPGENGPNPASQPMPIRTLPPRKHLALFAAGAALTLAMGFFFKNYTPTALPYPDSFITAFSILATLLTVRKILENWLYWIVLDSMAVFVFAAREAYLVALVMGLYAIISVGGYVSWRRKWKEQER